MDSELRSNGTANSTGDSSEDISSGEETESRASDCVFLKAVKGDNNKSNVVLTMENMEKESQESDCVFLQSVTGVGALNETSGIGVESNRTLSMKKRKESNDLTYDADERNQRSVCSSSRQRKKKRNVGGKFSGLDKCFEYSEESDDENNSDDDNSDDDNDDEYEGIQTVTGNVNKDDRYRKGTNVLTYQATPKDILSIENMIANGYGIVGHENCKVELKQSRLGEVAGRGLFVKEGCVIRDGDCITEYSGEYVHEEEVNSYPVSVQLYNLCVDKVCINGHREPVEGKGFGSFCNSSVRGYASVVRFVVYNGKIYLMCTVDPRYPLRGGHEVFLSSGIRWWKTYYAATGSRKSSNTQKV